MAEIVVWPNAQVSPVLTRYHGNGSGNTLYSPANQAAATAYFNGLLPWGSIKRCNVNSQGVITAWNNGSGGGCGYSDTGPSNVMVLVPSFCLLVDTTGAGGTIAWVLGNIGDTFTLQGGGTYTFAQSDLQPAFFVDGVLNPTRLLQRMKDITIQERYNLLQG